MPEPNQTPQPQRDVLDTIMNFLAEPLQEIGDEMKRLGVQGQAELASALFTGNSYVPYGQGQNRSDIGTDGQDLMAKLEAMETSQPEPERDVGREM